MPCFMLNIHAKKKISVLQYSEDFPFKCHQENKKKIESLIHIFSNYIFMANNNFDK